MGCSCGGPVVAYAARHAWGVSWITCLCACGERWEERYETRYEAGIIGIAERLDELRRLAAVADIHLAPARQLRH